MKDVSCFQSTKSSTVRESVTIIRRVKSVFNVLMTVTNDLSSGQKVWGKWEHRNQSAHHPLRFARLYGSSSRAKVTNTASTKGEPSDKICEAADAPASFKSDAYNGYIYIYWN